MCLNESELQEIIDHNYRGNLKEALDHIEACSECKKLFLQLKTKDEFVSKLMNDGMHLPPQPVLTKEWDLNEESQTIWGLNFMKTINIKWKATAAVALVGLMLMTEPVQVAADSFLKLFRMQELETVSITEADIHELDYMMGHGDGEVSIENIGKFEFSTDGEEFFNDDPKDFTDITDKFPDMKVIKNAKHMNLDYLSMVPKSTVRFTLDVESTNEILVYLGSDNMLPESLHEKTFEMTTDEFVNYTMIESGKKENNMEGRLNVTIMGEPQLGMPKDVNAKDVVNALANSGLIPSEIKRQLIGFDRLESIIPIPYSEESQIRTEKTINGYKTIIIEDKDDDEAYGTYTTAYLKVDSYFYIMSGENLNKDTLIELIEEME